jgi:hypothetical protein
MNGKLAAGNLTTANVATSVYRCRTTGAAFISVSICNRSAETAEITLGVSDSANSSDVASIIEYKTELLPKNVLERTGVAVSSTQYLTVTSSVANVSVVATGVETGTFDDSIPEIAIVYFESLTSPLTLDDENVYGTGAGDQFGRSVAVSGDKTIIGAFGEDAATGAGTGAAYIINTGGTLVHTLTNPGGAADDGFGLSVDISSNTAVVGAYGHNTYAGRAFIYNVSSGALEHTISPPTSANSLSFGETVRTDGVNAIISSPGEGSNGGASGTAQEGKAHIFNVSTGSLVHTLDHPNSSGGDSAYDQFSNDAVDISGGYAIVGAYNETPVGGKAYIFNVSSGALVHTLDNPNADGAATTDRFGSAVAIDGDYAVVGNHTEYYSSGSTGAGVVYIYNVTTGALLHTVASPIKDDVDGDYGNFGKVVDVSGYYAVIGSEGYSVPSSSNGRAYVVDVRTGTVVQTIENPNAYGVGIQDKFGSAVAIDNRTLVIGAYQEDEAGSEVAYSTDNSGKAYVYQG